MLEDLPDGIVIADAKQISYINCEAWNLLSCMKIGDGNTIDEIVCLDMDNCSVVTPLDQLIMFLTNIDGRIQNVEKEDFLEQMINYATDEAVILNMHQGLANPCGEGEDAQYYDDEGNPIPQNMLT